MFYVKESPVSFGVLFLLERETVVQRTTGKRLETLRHDRDMAADPSATHHRIGEAKRTDEGVGSTTFGGSLSLLEIFFNGMSCFFWSWKSMKYVMHV